MAQLMYIKGFLRDIDEFELIDGVADAIKR